MVSVNGTLSVPSMLGTVKSALYVPALSDIVTVVPLNVAFTSLTATSASVAVAETWNVAAVASCTIAPSAGTTFVSAGGFGSWRIVTVFGGAVTAARPGKPSVAERFSVTVVPLGVATGMVTRNDCVSVCVFGSLMAGELAIAPVLLVSANDCTTMSSVA